VQLKDAGAVRLAGVALAVGLFALLGLGPSQAADQNTIRVALPTEPVTFDPHALNAGSTTLVNRSLYEALVGRDETQAKVPQLATSWSRLDPRRWRFFLRPNVRFHDGSLLTPADVVFSLQRAASDASDFQLYVANIERVETSVPGAVDIVTKVPDEILADELTRVFIVSEAWQTQHGLASPPRLGAGGGVQASEANGTGPYALAAGNANGRIELTRFGDWWGATAGEKIGNVGRVSYQTIPVGAARAAALLSGDADILIDAPPELVPRLQGRPDLKIATDVEYRTVMLGFDEARPTLLYGSTPVNPFLDKRVRQAVELAIDAGAIRDTLMNGFSVPAGTLIAPSVAGYTREIDARLPVDLAAARQLLREAGYGDGFTVTLDCPRDRYVRDADICAAVGGMLARIGITVRVNVAPFPVWYGKLRRHDTSFFMIGWGTPTFDALFSLQALLHSTSPGGGPNGAANAGDYRNPLEDKLIDALENGTYTEPRPALIQRILQIAKDDVAYVPLHHQVVVWAMKRQIDAVVTPEGQLDVKWVTINPR
jgi:peptide/nickel transport system substrate-binding protein